jgi:hypothetical protein
MTAPNASSQDATRHWLALAAVAAAFLVVGFAAGWLLRGDGGEATVLPATVAGAGADAEPPGADAPRAAPAADPSPPTARPRAQVEVVVLNGVGRAGLAAETAERLRRQGYERLAVGDAPPRAEPSTAFFVAGVRAEAERLRRDLELSAPPRALPDGPIRDLVPPAAQVVVVLGAG